eukprot:CAMPEP_0170642910 /NCGR_PEP_ID=MMETSP0224-20130122/41587_1 /TAXON_ID=285029 /ORGANISM="Togula jolla, Strain CCCM 725" /LENGTH=48 /DNA_ID= /DNA_START= /DNA_END= /DNA_ORIENTATION=
MTATWASGVSGDLALTTTSARARIWSPRPPAPSDAPSDDAPALQAAAP